MTYQSALLVLGNQLFPIEEVNAAQVDCVIMIEDQFLCRHFALPPTETRARTSCDARLCTVSAAGWYPSTVSAVGSRAGKLKRRSICSDVAASVGPARSD